MFNQEKLTKIIDMMKMLTEADEMKWEVKKGLFTSTFKEDLYEIDPLLFTINGSPVSAVVVSKSCMDFYTYLNTKVLGDSIMDKLDQACDGKFLG